MGKSTAEDRARLDLAEAQARVEKLKAETQVLQRQLTATAQRQESIKAYAAAAGVVTAMVALIALFVSGWLGLSQISEARMEKSQERLDKAIADIGNQAPGQRLSGVANLRSFLGLPGGSGQRDTQILLALVHSLAIEENPTVRSALQEVLRSVDRTSVQAAATDAALQGLIGLSRGLVNEGTLYRERVSYHQLPQAASVEARAQSLSDPMVALLRAGSSIRNFAGIYCVRCDFSRLSINSANFDNAILSGADFYAASLEHATFDRADIESVNFAQAHLRWAKFTQSPLRNFGSFTMRYAFDRAEANFEQSSRKETSGANNGPKRDIGFFCFLACRGLPVRT